jgi:DNA-binding transcriptional ArsR family regulator
MLARRGQLSASDISKHFKMSAPAISQHLKVLREAKVIDMEKRAQQRLYRINPATLQELEQWVHQLTERWQESFELLDEILEQEKKKVKR